MSTPPGNARRGFASLTPERLRAIASQGGKTAWATGRAHRWTSTTAAKAGALGGRQKGRNRAARQTGNTP